MGIRNWVTKQPQRYREQGFQRATRENRHELITHTLKKFDPIVNSGTQIFEREWDVLLVLDACRADVLESVSSQYSFLPNSVTSERSVASCSRLWMKRNFVDEHRQEMKRTNVITANPFSDTHLSESWFADLDEVWKYAWDSDLGTVPCRPVTDRAIETVRSQDPDRLIVHYLQPHFPSVPQPIGSGIELESFGEDWDSVWTQLKYKEIEFEKVWDSYRENLKYVLNDVELLLDNMNREKIIITSDHGNAFGEWDQYGHPANIPIPTLRRVPWVEASGTDTRKYSPSIDRDDSTPSKSDVQDRLSALGYL